MRVIVSAGGTGGHIYPALAIIDFLKEIDKDLEILYIGTHNRMEKDIIPEKGIEYKSIELYGFNKKKVLTNVKNVYLLAKAYGECKKIIKGFKPDLVVGAGGYVTFPVLKAAQKLGVKTFIHEQNSFAGKTNVALGKHADLIGVSFEKSINNFKNTSGKVFLMGNPCGSRALSIKPIKKSDIGFADKKDLVVVVAGSLGSSSVNRSFKEIIPLLGSKNYQLLFITGNKLYDSFVEGLEIPKNVKVIPYLNNLSGLLRNTDVLISRAGASTMSEVIALNVPTIFIPSPYVANNHQYYNALDLTEKNAAYMIEEKDINSKKVLDNIDLLLKSSNDIRNNLKNINVVDSRKVFIKEVSELLDVK